MNDVTYAKIKKYLDPRAKLEVLQADKVWQDLEKEILAYVGNDDFTKDGLNASIVFFTRGNILTRVDDWILKQIVKSMGADKDDNKLEAQIFADSTKLLDGYLKELKDILAQRAKETGITKRWHKKSTERIPVLIHYLEVIKKPFEQIKKEYNESK